MKDHYLREVRILVYLEVVRILKEQTLGAEMSVDRMDWVERAVVGKVHSKSVVLEAHLMGIDQMVPDLVVGEMVEAALVLLVGTKGLLMKEEGMGNYLTLVAVLEVLDLLMVVQRAMRLRKELAHQRVMDLTWEVDLHYQMKQEMPRKNQHLNQEMGPQKVLVQRTGARKEMG